MTLEGKSTLGLASKELMTSNIDTTGHVDFVSMRFTCRQSNSARHAICGFFLSDWDRAVHKQVYLGSLLRQAQVVLVGPQDTLLSAHGEEHSHDNLHHY